MQPRKGDLITVEYINFFGEDRTMGYLCVLRDFDLQAEWKWFKENTGPGSYAGEWPYCPVFLDHLVEQEILGLPPDSSPRIHTFPVGRNPKLSYSTQTRLIRFDD